MMALLAMMAVLFGTTACGDSIFGQTRIKGSGNLITRTVAVGNFHTVDASRGVKVVISDEPGEVEICADDNLIEYVRVGVDDGELKVTVAPRIHAVPSEQILVRVPHNGKFFRFLLLQALTSINISKDKFLFVPLQDFSKPWTDSELYEKYNLTDEEINFIESMIRPMDLGGDNNG